MTEDIANKISALINDSDKRAIFGEMAFQKIKTLCDLDEYGKLIHSIYDKIENEKDE